MSNIAEDSLVLILVRFWVSLKKSEYFKGHAFIMINSKGENVIVIVGGANMQYDDLTKLPQEYQDAINNSIFVSFCYS